MGLSVSRYVIKPYGIITSDLNLWKMKKLHIPVKFFETISKESAMFKVLWMDWLGDYADKVLNRDFCDNYKSPYKGVDAEKIREIWSLGVGFLKDGLSLNSEKEKKNDSDRIGLINEIIGYLNLKAKTNYGRTKKNAELINARINEGYALEQFKSVIDKKVGQWSNTEMAKYLRPLTLFSASKFENYLNEPEITENAKSSNFSNLIESVSQAKAFVRMGGHEKGA